MKVTGIRNAIIFFFCGLVGWGLLVWLPHREFQKISDVIGRPENLPPFSRDVYKLESAIFDQRWVLLAIFPFICAAYYLFYRWAARGPSSRMFLHKVVVWGMMIAVYGLLIYCMMGLRVVVRGLPG